MVMINEAGAVEPSWGKAKKHAPIRSLSTQGGELTMLVRLDRDLIVHRP